MAALSTIHDVTGRRLVSSIYSGDIYGLRRCNWTNGSDVAQSEGDENSNKKSIPRRLWEQFLSSEIIIASFF
jgi:hypothetical protein